MRKLLSNDEAKMILDLCKNYKSVNNTFTITLTPVAGVLCGYDVMVTIFHHSTTRTSITVEVDSYVAPSESYGSIKEFEDVYFGDQTCTMEDLEIVI